jgi:DNA-binding NarL/FixJ family response regulator
MRSPIVVTHPSPLLHSGLHQLLVKSFRPVRIATALTDDLEAYLVSLESAVWVMGVERSSAATNALVRKVVAANACVKPVIMAASQEPAEIVAALNAGACGYVRQDIAGEMLLKSLELITHGEMTVCPQLASIETAPENGQAADKPDDTAAYVHTNETQSGDVPSLSRREMLILRMLVQGASNKTIALKLVMTESTVKVRMKAILRKLRLQNRTQAAMWARNHIPETTFTAVGGNGSSSVLTHHS